MMFFNLLLILSIILNSKSDNNISSDNNKENLSLNETKSNQIFNKTTINEIKNSTNIYGINYNLSYSKKKLDTNKKNLLIGTIENYDWDTIKPFFKSFQNAGFENCDCVMFVERLSISTINNLTSCGIIVYQIPENLQNFGIVTTRWKIYEDFLNENQDKYNLVLATDVRDSYFQLDAFKFYDIDKSFLGIAIEDGKLTEIANHVWIKNGYTEELFKTIKDERIICAGTVWGTADKFKEFSKVLWENLNSEWAKKNDVTDQGVANYLISHDKLFNDCLVKSDNDEGRIMTIGISNKENFKFDSENNLKNYKKGEIAAVVHQYDRHKEFTKIVKDKFCNPVNVLILGFDKYKTDESSKKISFSIYFFLINNKIYAKKLSFMVNIKYNNNLLRGINEDVEEKVKIECNRVGYVDNNVEFNCELNYEEKK